MSSWIVFVARLLSPDFRQLSREVNRVQLITISFSHYCELARWALDWCGVAYDEYGAAPLQHVFPTLSIRIGKQGSHLSSSSRTTEVALPGLSPEELDSKKKRDEKTDKAARVAAVPVAVAPDGVIWLDSWDIAERSGMKGIDPQLKLLLDHDVGPLSRQFAYYFVLKESNSNVWNALCTTNRHWIWKLLWWLGLSGFLKRRLLGVMKTDNAEAFRTCKEQLERAMARLDEIVVARSKERHIDLIPPVDLIDIGDLAIASLVAPLVNPPLYCNGIFEFAFDLLMRQDGDMRQEVLRWRGSTAGRFAMGLYQSYRRQR